MAKKAFFYVDPTARSLLRNRAAKVKKIKKDLRFWRTLYLPIPIVAIIFVTLLITTRNPDLERLLILVCLPSLILIHLLYGLGYWFSKRSLDLLGKGTLLTGRIIQSDILPEGTFHTITIRYMFTAPDGSQRTEEASQIRTDNPTSPPKRGTPVRILWFNQRNYRVL